MATIIVNCYSGSPDSSWLSEHRLTHLAIPLVNVSLRDCLPAAVTMTAVPLLILFLFDSHSFAPIAVLVCEVANRGGVVSEAERREFLAVHG